MISDWDRAVSKAWQRMAITNYVCRMLAKCLLTNIEVLVKTGRFGEQVEDELDAKLKKIIYEEESDVRQ